MSAREAFEPLNLALLTVSNRRTAETDTSGDLLAQLAGAAGHRVVERAIDHGDAAHLRGRIAKWLRKPDIQVIISAGGTGIGDPMPEAVTPLIEDPIPGFATLFQVLSLGDIGTSGMLSRAMAGVAGGKLLFLLPGSGDGCRLGMSELILPQLDCRTQPCSLAGLILPKG